MSRSRLDKRLLAQSLAQGRTAHFLTNTIMIMYTLSDKMREVFANTFHSGVLNLIPHTLSEVGNKLIREL